MVRFVGLFLFLAGLFFAYVGMFVPMNDMGPIGSIDGTTWVRTSMSAVGLGSMALGLLALFTRSRRKTA
jgi:hypothetical protein